MSKIINIGADIVKPQNWLDQHPEQKKHTEADLFLMIYFDVMVAEPFLRFVRTPAASVWFFLYRYIIRSPDMKGYGEGLYNDYYLDQNKLVARWNEVEIAVRIGLSPNSVSQISKAVNTLEQEWKFIKIHKLKKHLKTLNVYEFGYWEEIDGVYTETIYLNEVIREHLAQVKGDDPLIQGSVFELPTKEIVLA